MIPDKIHSNKRCFNGSTAKTKSISKISSRRKVAELQFSEKLLKTHFGIMSRAIGIDLGTVYSCVGVVKNGQVEIIANNQGNRVTPSVVAFAGQKRLVGDAAKYQMSQNPENTVYGEEDSVLFQVNAKSEFPQERNA
jgi:hypothetical protein